MILLAQAVSSDFGNDRRRRNRGDARIAAHNRFSQHRQPGQTVPINQHLDRFQSQTLHRPLHGQQARLQNIERINFSNARLPNRAAQRVGHDLIVQPLAARRAKRLGVSQALNRPQVVKNDRSGHHRSSQRATARFINARVQAWGVPAEYRLFRDG